MDSAQFSGPTTTTTITIIIYIVNAHKLRHLILYPCELPGRQTKLWASVWTEILRSFYSEFTAFS